MKKSEEYLTARCGGICYPNRPLQEVDAFFARFLGCQDIPTHDKHPPDFCGIIAPHLDFRVTEHAYATAYRPYLTADWPELFVILGVGHRARREWSTDGRDWQTVFGRAQARDLGLFPDPAAYRGEHSIEFALVCLQAIQRWRGIEQPLRFVPVLCGGLFSVLSGDMELAEESELHELTERLQRLQKEFGKKLGWIVSIDGCHLGPRFGHPFPVTTEILLETKAWENKLWKEIAKPDLDGFIKLLRRDANQRYFDGVGALALLRSVLGPNARIERTDEEQWFEPSDASVVTVSAGIITS